MKKTLTMLLVAAFVAGAGLVNADTLTNKIAGYSTVTGVAMKWYKQDQSEYPNQDARFGNIVRNYIFDVDGGAVSTNLRLEVLPSSPLPQGLLIVGGYIQVSEALQPDAATNITLSIAAEGDILAAGAAVNAAGLVDVVPQDFDIDNAVHVTGTNMYLRMNIPTAITQGMFQVVLPCFYGQSR